MQNKSAVLLLSGGIDSTTLAYKLSQKHQLITVAINYGQRHSMELAYARQCAERLKSPHLEIDLQSASQVLTTSALVNKDLAIPHGHYTDPAMRSTIVPNRNAILLSVGVAVAVARQASLVFLAAHAGDQAIYPDCQPAFFTAFETMTRIANAGQVPDDFRIEAPFIEMTKNEIVQLGHQLEVPWTATWSCYQGASRHCGRCGACVERQESFALANITDPTEYED